MSERETLKRGRADNRATDGQEQRDARESEQGRTTAEWVVLGVSLLVVLGVIGLLVYDLVTAGNRPAVVEVEPRFEELREEEGRYYLPAALFNQGGRTAENVTLSATLTPEDGESESASFTIRFLAPRERDVGVLIFNSDPSEGQLEYTLSYVRP
ncbi:MAG: hypothetical protein M3220_14045 [Chloroflexota bacterium]|nr:hypothetical protein [Chloroflexota bacterium]